MVLDATEGVADWSLCRAGELTLVCVCAQGSTITCVPGGTTASSTRSAGRTAPRAATASVCRRA